MTLQRDIHVSRTRLKASQGLEKSWALLVNLHTQTFYVSFPFVMHCVHVSQTRLKVSQGLARFSSSAQEPISNGVQFGELKAIGTHRRWGFLQICIRRRSTFSFPFFPRTVPFSPRRNVGKWISYFSETVVLPTRCMRVHLHCVCVCVRACVCILIYFRRPQHEPLM